VLPLLGIPAIVLALAAQPPAHLATCELSHSTQHLHLGTDRGTTVTGNNELHVRFTNNANERITHITFALSDGSTVDDDGTFAPGVTINQTFDLTPNDADSCSVESATFADGTEWNAD
jgi:hypothetical protein